MDFINLLQSLSRFLLIFRDQATEAGITMMEHLICLCISEEILYSISAIFGNSMENKPKCKDPSL